jgi:hypothetical protein
MSVQCPRAVTDAASRKDTEPITLPGALQPAAVRGPVLWPAMPPPPRSGHCWRLVRVSVLVRAPQLGEVPDNHPPTPRLHALKPCRRASAQDKENIMFNKTWAFVVALALAAAPVTSLPAAAPSVGGNGPPAGALVGGGAATSKRSQRIAPQHQVAAPHGTRQPIVRGKQPIRRTPHGTRQPIVRSN